MSDVGYVSREDLAVIKGETLQRFKGEVLAAGLPLNARTTAYSNHLIVKSGPGTLFGLSGFSSAVASQWIQVHDFQGGIPPNGAVPELIISVATVTNFSAAWVIPGRFFFRGCVICNSSTGPTLTIGSADCWFDAQFI